MSRVIPPYHGVLDPRDNRDRHVTSDGSQYLGKDADAPDANRRRPVERIAHTGSHQWASCLLAEVVDARERRWNGQAERVRELLVFSFAFRLLRGLEVEEGEAAGFRTSSTTSCHQCSAGTLSSPSSR
jgi:hypothetical protein